MYFRKKQIYLFTSLHGLVIMLCSPQMYGARPIRRWVHKNVMTKLSELLVKGEAGEGTMVFVDATTDKKGLKYQVVKKVIEARVKKPVMEVPSDSYDSDDVVEVFPIAKKAKVEGL